jgi:prepilin-type N-terminal cleavage/methylation domain-containing protein
MIKDSRLNQRGFTLTEILVVLGLLIIVSGFALVVSMDSYRRYNFRNEQNLLLGVLLKARSQAISNINQKPHGVHLDQAAVKYTLFQGSPFAGRPAADSNLDITYNSNSAYVLTGLTDVIFSQLTGQPNASGAVTLDDHIHPVFNICINAEGQINVKASCP